MKKIFTIFFVLLLIYPFVLVQSSELEKKQKISLSETAIVYATPGETVFHLSKCEKLGKARMSMSLKSALRKGYTPCPLCIPMTQESKTFQLNYDISLSEVERPVEARKRYGEVKIEKVEEEGLMKYIFEDEMIMVFWILTPEVLGFALKNKTDHSIKIIWDEGAYVDINGGSHRIVHSGIKYMDKDKPQAPSVVVRKGNLKDSIYPSDFISWSGKDWKKRPFFIHEERGMNSDLLLEKAKHNIGKKVQVLLPLQIEGVLNDYIFVFTVNDVVLVK